MSKPNSSSDFLFPNDTQSFAPRIRLRWMPAAKTLLGMPAPFDASLKLA